jgi:hypothetical protein
MPTDPPIKKKETANSKPVILDSKDLLKKENVLVGDTIKPVKPVKTEEIKGGKDKTPKDPEDPRNYNSDLYFHETFEPFSSGEWKDYARRQGWVEVPSNALYPGFDTGKTREVIINGKKVNEPIIKTYTRPTRNIQQPDPSKKTLNFNSNIGVYNPNTGMYTNPLTGDTISPLIEQYKKGGMVKGYEVGGGIPYAGNVQKTTPTRPVVLNSGATMSSGSNVQKAGSKQPVPTTTSQNSFSLSPQAQNAAVAGLNLGTDALNSYNAKNQGEMTYGSNAYFDKINKQNKNIETGIDVVGTGLQALGPKGALAGAALKALPAASKAIVGADAYGVSDKGDTRLALGAMLNPATAYQSLGKGYKEIAKGNFGRGLAYMTPLGALMTNDQNRYEREKLKFENEQGQNQAEYDQAVQDTQAQGKYNVQNALAMRNEGIANYTSNDFVKDPTLKKAEFVAPGKNKTLTAFGLAKGGEVPGMVYNNNLSKNDISFQNWYSKNTLEGQKGIPYSDNLDYDYYSFYKSKVAGDVKNHFPDTYKRSNHETFSDESSYAGNGSKGHWEGDNFIKTKKQGAVKGGTIKGDGTGTSDSINAQVKENSFVVPAKNNKVAKTLREMMLGDDPNTMAKVKQGMGPKVKLSNGEHLFTPAERAKLEAKGVNLYDLAPEAEGRSMMAKGGDPPKGKKNVYYTDKEMFDKAYKAEMDSSNAYNTTENVLTSLDKWNKNPSEENKKKYYKAQNENLDLLPNKRVKGISESEIIKPVSTKWSEQNAPDGNPDYYNAYKEPVLRNIYKPKLSADYLPSKDLIMSEEPELMPQRNQRMVEAPEYKTEIDTTNGNYQVKRFKDKTGKVVKEEYYDMNGKKINPAVEEYAKGGLVKGYAPGGDVTEDDFVKREQAKIDAERIRNEKVMSRQQAQLIAEKKTADLRYKKYQERQDIYKGLENQAEARKKADEDYKNSVYEYETLKKGYTEFVKSADEAKKQRPTAGQQLIGNQTTFAPDYEKEKQKRLAMVQEAKSKVDKSKRQLEFTSSEKNFVGDLAPKKPGTGLNYLQGDMPTQGYRPMTEANTATTTPAAAKKGASGTTTVAGRKAAAPVEEVVTTDYLAPKNLTGNKIPLPVNNDPVSLSREAQTLAIKPTDSNNLFDAANKKSGTDSTDDGTTGSKFSWQDGLGAAINYGLPLAQSLIGFNQLRKIGDRPVDKLDQDLVNAFDTTRGNAMKADLAARYGMSAEELAALRMQNAALTNTGRYNARNFSGGSGANALNMERSVINDSFDRALQAKIADKNLQMQKQQNAYAAQNSVNSLAQYKQEANRRLFQDDLTAFKEKTDAASGLMATGLSNLSDAAAADKRMREFRKMNSK